MLCTEQSFLHDVAEHQMTVVREDGLHRHLRFKKPGTMLEHFDLITWPGYLCITGDMGTYVFNRLDDMFQFFRSDRPSLSINLNYWAEKLESADRHGEVTRFCEERFNQAVLGDLICWLRNYRDCTTKDERRELWDAVVSEVLGADGDSGGFRKQTAAHDFYHDVNDEVGTFCFQDFWEHNVTEYSPRFVWCCYAIAWGVRQYDQSRLAPAA